MGTSVQAKVLTATGCEVECDGELSPGYIQRAVLCLLAVQETGIAMLDAGPLLLGRGRCQAFYSLKQGQGSWLVDW